MIKSVEIYLKQAMFTTKSTIRMVGNGIPTHVEFRLKELEPVCTRIHGWCTNSDLLTIYIV